MDGPYYMDAVITPSRSLSRKGFIILIGVMTAINVATAFGFWAIGAAPIPFFLGFDLLAVVVAFAVTRRSGSDEHIQVTAAEVRVLMRTRQGAEQIVWTSPTAFTQVDLNGDAGDATDLRLRLSGRQLPVAKTLSRPERLAFAQALHDAIRRARSGRPWGEAWA
jgi:uncharacterized membrane protein